VTFFLDWGRQYPGFLVPARPASARDNPQKNRSTNAWYFACANLTFRAAGETMQRISRRRVGALAALAVAVWVASGAAPAQSRPWKPKPNALALDYAQILDQRGTHDSIVLWWLVPPMMERASVEAQELLDKYVVLGIVHAHMLVGGTMSFDPVEGVEASDSDGTPLVLLTGDNIPPLAQGTLATLQAILQKAIGPMGQGFRWFVFEGGAVHACEAGGLSVAYDGETYTYETPIPGCPAK
jgi:hypothetical protein